METATSPEAKIPIWPPRQGPQVGVETIATSLGEEVDTIEDVYEPYLIQIGYISRTPRGRMVMPPAYEHLGYTFLG